MIERNTGETGGWVGALRKKRFEEIYGILAKRR
jgi:hypothetical protein